MKLDRDSSSSAPKATSSGIPWVTLLVSFLLLAVFGCQQLAGRGATAPAPLSGAELFKTKCGRCHKLDLALGKYRTEAVWFATISRMESEHSAGLSPDEIDRLVKYHVDRQRQETEVFKDKCQKCHPGKAFLEQRLTGEQARAIIKRMQLKAGNDITDQDVEIIVRYHAQAQQSATEENIRGIYRLVMSEELPGMKRGMDLFLEKCSSCHQPNRALTVIKDPLVWAQTIKRMQNYSQGAISDLDAEELVAFHVKEQEKEIDTFAETCTKCHDDSRINSRSMTEEQWLATIKRMQQKAPELISDEKVNLLAAYFHRRELALARIFSGKCQLCHLPKSGGKPADSASPQMDGLIDLANKEFGGRLQLNDVKYLLSPHIERQRRSMQVFQKECTTCHPGGPKKDKEPGTGGGGERSKEEWVSYIAALQGLELNQETRETINGQIDYHRTRY